VYCTRQRDAASAGIRHRLGRECSRCAAGSIGQRILSDVGGICPRDDSICFERIHTIRGIDSLRRSGCAVRRPRRCTEARNTADAIGAR